MRDRCFFRLIYILIICIVAYNVFFDSTEQKNNKLKIMQNYLSVEVPEDTQCVDYKLVVRNGASGLCFIRSELSGPNKDISKTKDALYRNKWIESSKENDRGVIYYTFNKNDDYLSYSIYDYIDTKKWRENVSAE